MADNKLNTSPEGDKSLGSTAPQGLGDSPSPEPVKNPSNSPNHEQAMIPGMGENALAGKMIDLPSIKAAADRSGKEPTAPDVADSSPELVPYQKRRAVRRKSCLGRLRRKRRKRRSPAQAVRLRLTRRWRNTFPTRTAAWPSRKSISCAQEIWY